MRALMMPMIESLWLTQEIERECHVSPGQHGSSFLLDPGKTDIIFIPTWFLVRIDEHWLCQHEQKKKLMHNQWAMKPACWWIVPVRVTLQTMPGQVSHFNFRSCWQSQNKPELKWARARIATVGGKKRLKETRPLRLIFPIWISYYIIYP